MSQSPPDQATLPSVPPSIVPADQERWFKEEVHPHGGQLKSWLRGQFPTVRDVDDVVQESYVRIWKVKTGKDIKSVKAFLFTIARNLALNVIRREKASPVTPDGNLADLSVPDDRPDAADCLSEQEQIDLLTDALASLPARTRAILLLYKIDGLTQIEVARELGFTPKVVDHQIYRGLALCAKYLRSRGYELF